METKILHQIRRLYITAAVFLAGIAGALAYDYTDYDYVNDFSSSSGGTTSGSYISIADEMLKFAVSASNGARTSTYTLTNPVDFTQKQIVEFDWNATSITSDGGTNPTSNTCEGQISFQTASNANVFTVYTTVASTYIYVAVGATTADQSPLVAEAKYKKALLDGPQLTTTGQLIHVKAEIDIEGQKISFTITQENSIDIQFELPLPDGFTAANGKISRIWFNSSRFDSYKSTWSTGIDNIGIKNADVVNPDVTVSQINISGPKYVIAGDSAQLEAEALPVEAYEKGVTWSSSNTSLATVNATTGVVTGVAASASATDSVTITATAADGGGATATYNLLVINQPVTGVTLQGVYHAIYTDNPSGERPFTISATVSPETAVNKELEWTSSNVGVATLNTNNNTEVVVTLTGVGRTTITASTSDGSNITAQYILDVAAEAAAGGYASYNYIDLLTNAGTNGAITHQGNGALLSYEVRSGDDYRLRFNGSAAQSGNRRSTYTFNEPVVFYQQAKVEFDFQPANHTGGSSGDEGQLTFRDEMDNDLFTLYNLNGTSNGLGVAVGALNFGTADDYNTRKAAGVAEAQRAFFENTPAGEWYHVAADVYLIGDAAGDPRITFTITGITTTSYTNTVTLPFPATFSNYGGIAKIFFNATRTSSNMYWDVSVDNIGVKKLDQTTAGQRLSSVEISGDTVVVQSKTLQLLAAVGPSDAENPTVAWSSTNESYVTVSNKGLVTGVALTEEQTPVYVKAVANDGGGAKDSIRIHVINQKVTGLTLSGSFHSFYTNNPQNEPPFKVAAVISPDDAFNKTLQWSSNAAIATLAPNAATDSVTVTLVGGTGKDTIRATTTDGSQITAEYYIDISVPDAAVAYEGYDYIELFNGGSANLNGTLTNNAGGCAAVERYDTYNDAEQMLHFNVDAQSGNRRATFTLNKTISYTKKVVVEFDWYPGDVTGGGTDDEGQISFRNGTGVDNDIFTVYNKRSTDGFSGIGLAVGSLNGTENSRRAHTIDENYRAHLSDVAAGLWYHVKAEIYKGHRVAFTITGADVDNASYLQKVVLPIPSSNTHSSITDVFFNVTRGGNVTWNTWVDNLGIKVDDDANVAATGVSIAGPNTVAQDGGTITLTASIEPWDVTSYSVDWSVNDGTYGSIVRNTIKPWEATLTGGSEGSVLVTATAASGVYGTKQLGVGKVLLDSVRIDGARAADTAPKEVSVNNAIALTAAVWPDNAGNKNLEWTSSDESIATVDDETGEVTGVSEGEVFIWATATDGSGQTDSCRVTVVFTNITRVDLQGARRVFYTATPSSEATFLVTSVVSPSTASIKSLSFESLNEEIATVVDNGDGTATVTLAGGFGKASIKANTADGSGVAGYYNLEVAEENPYDVFTDFETGEQDAVLTMASSDGTAKDSVFQKSHVHYFNGSGSGNRTGAFALAQQIEGDEIKLRLDWYAGSPSGSNDNGINNGLFSVRNAGGYEIITFGFINADNDSIKPLSYFVGEAGSAAFPFSDVEKAKRVYLTGVSNLDTWYTIDLTISYYKMRLDFTITERDMLENTQTVTNIPIPESNYQPNVRDFNIVGRRVSSAGLDITSCVDNLGYSKYTYQFVNVTFDPSGGFFGDNTETPKVEKVIQGETFASQVPTGLSKAGNDFTGWAYENETPYTPEDVLSSDATLYAQWEVKKFLVVFIDRGDTVKKVQIEYSTRISTSDRPSIDRPGYEIEGWYNGDDKWNFNTYVTSDLTLVAKWEGDGATIYTVTFINQDTTFKTDEVEAGATVANPGDPTREGYTFLGWFNGETKWEFTTAVTSDLTLTAKWTQEGDEPNSVASGVLSGVALYPNPASDAVTLTGLTGNETVELISISGSRLLLRKVTSDKETIDVSGLPSGIYLVRVTKGNATKHLKLIKN